MRYINLKSCTMALLCFITFSCSDVEIAPSEKSSDASIAAEKIKAPHLQNSFWASVRPYSMDFPYAELTFEGFETGKTLTINWGDGTIETYTFNEGYNGRSIVWMEHNFGSLDTFTISVTGDLSNVVSIISPLTTVETFEMNFEKLTRIENVDMPYNSIHTLDLSKNRRLKTLSGPSSILVKNIILPNTHHLEYLSSGSPNLSTEVVSDMIASVYKNAVTKKIHNGFFGLDTEMSPEPAFPGPPTEEDMAKLIELRDAYGWTIFPNP